MGSGKTSAAINYMNSHPKQRFMFVTQYLDEVERIINACPKLNFKQPINFGGGKKESLDDLLSINANIATTHELLKRLPNETLDEIKDGGYTLILDEVLDAVAVYDILKGDIDFLLDCNVIDVDESKNIKWVFDKEYHGDTYKDFMKKCERDIIVYNKRNVLFWILSKELFDVFDNVYILTYMFEAQLQKYYLDIYNIDFQYITVRREKNNFYFSLDEYDIYIPDYMKTLHEKIHIISNAELNRIGNGHFDLSTGWYRRMCNDQHQKILQLKDNVSLFFRKSPGCKSSNFLWTTWKKYKSFITSRGYSRAYTSFSLRATNKFNQRHFLAYCVNVFMNPNLKLSCIDRGADVKENMYSLSVMIQWIWRSAIRNGEEIWIYVPSRRMRCLLKMWLNDLKNGGDGKGLNYKNIDKNIDDRLCVYFLDPRSKTTILKEKKTVLLSEYFEEHMQDILGDQFQFVDFTPDRYKTFQYLVTDGKYQYPVFITSKKINYDIYRKARDHSKCCGIPHCFCIGSGLYGNPLPPYVIFIDYHSWDIELET